MKKSKLKKVNFHMIRYSNCWEDADLMLEGLDAQAGKSHLSIGSAGDNSFSLLTTHPEKVVAIDISPVQIYLIELKKVAIKNMSREAYLDFAGFNHDKEDTTRWDQYCEMRHELSEAARMYWNFQRNAICSGIIYSGKFERYFQIFARHILPLIHGSEKIKHLVEPKNPAKQKEFYETQWNTRRWRWLFRLFFSRRLMGWLGRDPAFLDQVKVPVAEFIFKKAEQHLCSLKAQQNHILDFALTGRFQKNLPHYVQPGNYEIIQKNLDKLYTRTGVAESAIEEFGSFDYFNLSNIFEYLDENHFREVSHQLMKGANPGAKMAYWNLMVERKMSSICPELKTVDKINQLQKTDKGFFYQRFWIERKVA